MIGRTTLDKIGELLNRSKDNYTINGDCSNCGECCSNFIPMSKKEIDNIKKYMQRNKIKFHKVNYPILKIMDLTCPFLDVDKKVERCKIYPVRPQICRIFICNEKPSKEILLTLRNTKMVNVRVQFKDVEAKII